MIYLDNTTTTKVDDKVLQEIEIYQKEKYGVAISDYSPEFSMSSKKVMDATQKIISEKINSNPDEMIFTSGQTEGNNYVLKGVPKGHIITTKIEHSSILKTCKSLEKQGYDVTYLDVNEEGNVDLNQLKESLRKDTVLVSIQHANQEVGTVQNIKEAGKVCKDHQALFHVDASHSFLRVPIDVEKMNIDLLTITSHLIHGPKGIGALYIRKPIRLKPLIQGTRIHNIPGIAGFGKAIELWKDKDNKKMRKQREKLIKEIGKIPNTVIFGSTEGSLPDVLSVNFKFIEGESIVLYLGMEDIVLSTGSACAGRGLKPSHVLEAMGYGEEDSHGSIRIGLSRYIENEDIDIFLKELKEVVNRLRDMSPIKG
ncbi:MAG: aminotransferase class V-fold PLP-dependent enzyme [Candidatus Aenigmarchaeota archaeon]|nr:aminotransferase class V-fold PLP-dependent enzyme [Candidatus Aenigmarchaeota archaeon]